MKTYAARRHMASTVTAELDRIHARRTDSGPLRVVVPAAGSQPDLTEMIRNAYRWGGIWFLGMHYTKDYTEEAKAAAALVKFFSPFMAAGDRAMRKAGLLELIDSSFANVGAHYEAMEPHAIVTEVADQESTGWVSLGSSADYTLGLINKTTIPVIFLLNAAQPVIHGNRVLDSRGIFVKIPPRPVYTVPAGKETDDPVVKAIAANVLGVLDDLDGELTLQLGVGAIPNAILKTIPTDRIGGLNTEVITSAMRFLPWGINIVGTMLLADQATLEWAHNNQDVYLYEVEQTNNPRCPVVSINQAMQFTTSGMAITGVGTPYSGVGGQADFAKNNTGTRIVVLPSLKDGISTIVPNIGGYWRQYANVSAHKPDYVVTEQGWARLTPHKKSDGSWFTGTAREVEAVIGSVAHPDYRPWLAAGAPRGSLRR